MSELNLEIITPSKSAFNGEIKAITVPGTKGRFQILKNHAPIISTIEIGMVKVDLKDGSSDYYAISGGTIEVLNNKVLVLADSIEKVPEIDEERALNAKQRAEERLAVKNSNINTARAKASIARANNRIQIKEKYK
ncbi:MAG: F0F1 ATP synthase subunit epsilon [Ignavibacteriaceae bacterium]|jgi:F-type H+-transporting ATPase subunit epsilon|nr:F0F1 ATP synthase subunit epsilon [Ignavibacteriaceae bacterium]